MYQINESLKGKLYEQFVDLLIERSDSFLFHLPNMGKTLINERNISYFPEYQIGYTDEEDQEDHVAYINKTKKYIDLIRDDIISIHTDTGYLDQLSNLEIEVYCVALSKKSKKFFLQASGFSEWLYPDYPEDICFLLNNKCVFQCIAHEDLCFVYLDDCQIKDFLDANGIDYETLCDVDVPINTGDGT